MAATAPERMRRLLALVPWVAAHDGPTVEEVCARFGLTRRELAADLEVIPFVGLPPYTPDQPIDVVFEEDRVWVRFAPVFERPMTLTPHQATSLLAAGASALALEGEGVEDSPLATGVAKLAAVLGVEPDEALEIDLGEADPGVLAAVRRAVAEQRRVRLDYYSHGRDARTVRVVDPVVVQADAGALYLLGHCHLAQAPRRFRVDRIAEAEVLDEAAAPPGEVPTGAVFVPDEDDPRVTLDLAPSARWVVETYPMEDVDERGDGTLRVRFAVAAERWLERLLVRLGGDAVVVDAPGDLAGAGRRAAQRILDRYR